MNLIHLDSCTNQRSTHLVLLYELEVFTTETHLVLLYEVEVLATETHLVLLYEVEVFAVVLKSVLEVPALLLGPKCHGRCQGRGVHAVTPPRLLHVTVTL